ncbi:uncharacterized protein TRAVEDRAFT_54514 [Trametes versicolor FP-101664 SS1]|uniref:Uncharacterized protein n=1 Tax=Trametes versicolor (strain FP-101664) TaxID=717944 RepID=R7S927_TRAVS|nr:uncharacterized protein TRAVEDRAFT_54514 [Trametes versicolor FP-101664 SS1]EIW51474.1 hypothetical protein TRAVEDRAFT_54514 [Trametes versicolor FP-101664 SS1]
MRMCKDTDFKARDASNPHPFRPPTYGLLLTGSHLQPAACSVATPAAVVNPCTRRSCTSNETLQMRNGQDRGVHDARRETPVEVHKHSSRREVDEAPASLDGTYKGGYENTVSAVFAARRACGHSNGSLSADTSYLGVDRILAERWQI